MGSIYRRNHFRQGVKVRQGLIWWIQFSRGGKKIRESSGSPKKEDALRLLRKRENQIAQGLPITQKTGSIIMDELFEDEITEWKTNARRSTRDLERRIELYLSPFFGRAKAERVTTADARKFILLRQDQGASNAEINRELSALRRSFILGIENTKLFARPHVPMLRENNTRTGFFEWQQFQSVHSHLSEDLQPVVSFAFITGWRISEILGLRWPQVDFQVGFVRLEPGTTKNNEARLFPFTDELHAILESQKAKSEALRKEGIICPFVFHRNGVRIRTFRRAWKTACRKAGLPGRLVHDFRRTAVRNLVRAGIPERVAMMMTGHKTRSVFERYNIVSENDLKSAAQRLNLFSSKLPAANTTPSA